MNAATGGEVGQGGGHPEAAGGDPERGTAVQEHLVDRERLERAGGVVRFRLEQGDAELERGKLGKLVRRTGPRMHTCPYRGFLKGLRQTRRASGRIGETERGRDGTEYAASPHRTDGTPSRHRSHAGLLVPFRANILLHPDGIT